MRTRTVHACKTQCSTGHGGHLPLPVAAVLLLQVRDELVADLLEVVVREPLRVHLGREAQVHDAVRDGVVERAAPRGDGRAAGAHGVAQLFHDGFCLVLPPLDRRALEHVVAVHAHGGHEDHAVAHPGHIREVRHRRTPPFLRRKRLVASDPTKSATAARRASIFCLSFWPRDSHLLYYGSYRRARRGRQGSGGWQGGRRARFLLERRRHGPAQRFRGRRVHPARHRAIDEHPGLRGRVGRLDVRQGERRHEDLPDGRGGQPDQAHEGRHARRLRLRAAQEKRQGRDDDAARPRNARHDSLQSTFLDWALCFSQPWTGFSFIPAVRCFAVP